MIKRTLKKYSFEAILMVLFLLYSILYITPSSYGVALSLFGLKGDGLLWGTPKPIRSDEWAVWTPYMQVAVNNGFSQFNKLSMFHENLRSFNALPLYDWALIFKPLMWPFLIFEPARAFSIHHGLIILSFIFGWQLFFQTFITKINNALHPETSYYRISSIFFSLLIFESSFVQVWWTTLGPILAITPWVILALLQNMHLLKKYCILSYLLVVWVLSHTYPPIIISSGYFFLIALLVCNISLLKSIRNLSCYLLAGMTAAVIVYFYYHDVINIISNTVYPGKRISLGGDVDWLLVLSSFLPYIIQSNYSDLIGANICEIGVTSSLLPIFTLFFIDYNKFIMRKEHFKNFAIMGVSIILITVWMTFGFPEFVAKLTFLSLSPAKRWLFIYGLLINLFFFYILTISNIIFSWKRFFIFSFSLIIFWLLPSMLGLIDFFRKSAWELTAIPLLALVFFTRNNTPLWWKKQYSILIICFIVNAIYFSTFNPLQSSKAIFSASKDSSIIKALKKIELSSPNKNLIIPGYPGAILTGAGLNSFTTVLIYPQLSFFKKMYPDMPIDMFNKIFNRYAHIIIQGERMSV